MNLSASLLTAADLTFSMDKGDPVLPQADTLLHLEKVMDVILKECTELFIPARKVDLAQILSVYQYPSFGRVVETGEKFDNGGLAGAVRPYEGELAPAVS